MIIPLARLEKGCSGQVALVRAEWPGGIPVTEETAARCIQLRLDLNWAAQTLLTAPAWAEFERVKAAAWAEFKWGTAAAWAEFERVKAAALLRLLLADPKGGISS